MRKFFQIYSSRINNLTFVLLSFSIILLCFFYKIQIIEKIEIKKTVYNKGYREIDIYGNRGQILDVKNRKLSESINKYSFWINTNKDFDYNTVVEQFSSNFNKPDTFYKKILTKKSNYVNIEKNFLFFDFKNILNKIKNIKGLNVKKESKRFYPYNNLASQTIGYVDINGLGQGGVEGNFNTILSGDTVSIKYRKGAKGKYYNNSLKKKNINGKDIRLTINIDIQQILQEELNRTLKITKSKSANGIIMNPHTGDIIAISSVPDFDPNKYYNYDLENFKNRVIADSYEPGSTFKIVPLLASLKKDINSLEKKYYCENGTYKLSNRIKLHDHNPYDTLTAKDIFVYSSNIGISKIVSNLNNKDIFRLCKNFGFGSKTGIPFRNESAGKLRDLSNWSNTSKTYISIGQEIGVTNLQLALAYSAIANGGYLLKPHIIKEINNEKYLYNREIEPIRRVFNLLESKEVLESLSKVVQLGTAKNLNLDGYKIGGKTGTAQKYLNDKYSDNEFIASFASIFPLDNPKYVIIVSLDSPYYGTHWANESAVPLTKNIINRIIINDSYLYAKRDINKKRNLDAEIARVLSDNKIIKSDEIIYKTNIYIKNDSQSIVPNLKGKHIKEALKIANSSGFELELEGSGSIIIWQSLKAGSKLKKSNICKVRLSI